MTNTINQHVRRNMGISSVHYLIMDVCAQYKSVLKRTHIKDIALDTGLSERMVSNAINDLSKSLPMLLQRHDNDCYYPTQYWYESVMGQPIKVSTADAELARQVVEYFNEANSTKYLIPNNVELIKNILKVYPRLTLEHFKSVILHKLETWGVDEGMKQYNRPTTIFRSAQRFLGYLDDASIYWTNKSKKDEYERQNR